MELDRDAIVKEHPKTSTKLDACMYPHDQRRCGSMQHVSAAVCRTNRRLSVALLFAIALVNAVAAFEAETSTDLRPWGVLALWLSSIVAFLAGAALLRAPQTVARPAARLSRFDLAAIVALTVAALLARTIAVTRIPWNIDGDEGEMGTFAREILDGRWDDPFAPGWSSDPALWFYFQALALKVFGDGLLGLRLLTALIGTATVPALYLFSRRCYGSRVALMAAALLVVYHFHIHYSRLGVPEPTNALFTLVGFGLALAGLNSRSPLLLAGAGVTLGFAQNLYYGTRLGPVVLLVVLAHQLLVSRATVTAVARYLPLTALGFLIGWGPGVRVPFDHWADYTARYAIVGIFQSGWFAERERMGESPFHILWHQAVNAGGAITSVPDRGPHYWPEMPLLDRVSALLFLIGLTLVLFRWRRVESALLLAWLVVALTFGGVLVVNTPESQRLVTLAPLICLLVAMGLDALVRGLTRVAPAVRPLAPGLAAVGVAALAAWNLHFYFIVYTPRHSNGFRATESATAIGRYLASRPGLYVYFVGPPHKYLTHGSIEFVARNPPGFDVPESAGARGLPPPPPGARPLVVFDPARMGELASVRQHYPGTGARIFRSEVDGEPLFAAYSPYATDWHG